ncbi:MAG: hypothetical protein AAGC49_12745 [Brevundimonas sp.]
MVPAPVVVGMRPLTPAELTHLGRLREFLVASGVEVSDPRALGALLDSQLARWESAGGTELPDAMLAAFGVGIGDLVLAAAPTAHWVLRTSSERPAPALLSPDGAAVVPLDDVRDRWSSGVRDWVPSYVEAAARHLTPELPAASSASTPSDAPQTPAAAPAESPASLSAHTPDDGPADAPGDAPSDAATRAPARGDATAFRSRREARLPRPRIPADLPVPPSVAVQVTALRLLDRALELACAAPDPAALAYVEFDGILRRAADVDNARAIARASGATIGAVVWVGGLDDEGRVAESVPAVLVEAGEAGAATLVVGHRFEAAPVGDLVIVGQGAPLL